MGDSLQFIDGDLEGKRTPTRTVMKSPFV